MDLGIEDPEPMEVDPPAPQRRRRLPKRPGMDWSDLQTLYDTLTAPSAGKLYQIQKRRGLNYTNEQVTRFVKSQGLQQRFAPKPAPDAGHIASLSPNDLWQVDVVDMTRYSPDAKEAMKWFFIAIRVHDRQIMAIPLPSKSAYDNAVAIRKVIEVWGAPRTISSDRGPEWESNFSDELDEQDIRHVEIMPGDHVAMGVVDRAILTLRTRINKWMEATGSTQWHVALDRIVNEYNDTPHRTLHGGAPNDASSDPWLETQLKVDNTIKLYQNSRLKRHKIKVGQRFRAPLRRGAFSRGFVPRYSAHVYTVERLVPGGYVESEGQLFKKKDILIVPGGSTDVGTSIGREAEERRGRQRLRRVLGRRGFAVEEEEEPSAMRRAQDELLALDPSYDFRS